ncbi:hypothetical protein ACFL5G_02305 [Candidatus Margulisiibacteriota bacterium]
MLLNKNIKAVILKIKDLEKSAEFKYILKKLTKKMLAKDIRGDDNADKKFVAALEMEIDNLPRDEAELVIRSFAVFAVKIAEQLYPYLAMSVLGLLLKKE